MIKKSLEKLYLALIIILLYAPILTLVILSFNSSKTRSRWGGFTGKWYVSLFQNKEIMGAFYNTLIIALLSALIAAVIGTAASLGIQAMTRKFQTVVMGVTNIPMLNADIVTGISLMLLFIGCRITLGFATVLMAHITFNIPYVILSVMPKLKQTSRSAYEAALDLGASPLYAFYKVVFPDILPGVFSGFLLAFTMSLDDFIITHFTKGPGVETLSTKIYSEVRKGIKPEMYALSTLLFVSVLFLLILINTAPRDKARRRQERQAPSGQKDLRFTVQKALRFTLCRLIPMVAAVAVITGGVFYRTQTAAGSKNRQLVVYNWGDYINPQVLGMFEEETGIQVIYEEFETNEIMYPKIASGAIAYDVVCPSDYTIQRMIENDLLAELDYGNIPNLKNISPIYLNQSRQFDPENKYSVPYLWGTVGILYNKTMVDQPIDSWGVLWDERYRGSILMQDSVRDAFGITLKYLGYSLNSTDLDELTRARDMLIAQKPLVQAYVVDQVRDKMIGGEAAIGVIYSGEVLYTQMENSDLEYVIPREGSNLWIDSWVIPKNAQNKEGAEAFINFLCRPDIAKMNFDYITYSIPNEPGRQLIEDPALRSSPVAFPPAEDLENCETFRYLGEKNDKVYNELWREVKSR